MPVPEWIFLPVLIGYFFFHASALFRYRSRRIDGPRLILECALWGGMFFAAGRGTCFWLHENGWLSGLESAVGKIPLPLCGTTLIALSLAVLAALALNLFIPKLRALALAGPSGSLQSFLREAAANHNVIAVTLDTRKVYIGFITEVPTLDPNDTHIAILPLLSGYRHHETMELRLTSNYARAYESPNIGPDPARFTVYLPVTSFRSACHFDMDVPFDIFTERSIVSVGS